VFHQRAATSSGASRVGKWPVADPGHDDPIERARELCYNLLARLRWIDAVQFSLEIDRRHPERPGRLHPLVERFADGIGLCFVLATAVAVQRHIDPIWIVE
jgi:hypothetical protein